MRALLHYARIAYHWKLARKTELPYVPEDISVEVTNNCNFRCSYCSQSNPQHFAKVARSHLEPQQCSEILGKLRLGGVTSTVIHWTLDGEPFVNRKFAEICKVGHSHGFTRAIFSTNGALATAERLRELPRGTGISYTLCVDFASDPHVFEAIRGTKGSWERVLGNIREALAAPDLDHISFRVTDISSYQQHLASDARSVEQQLDDLLQKGPRLEFSTRKLHNATGFVSINTDKSGTYHVCPYPWTSMVIASNGDVVACCRDLEHKTVIGNLLRQNFDEVWNGTESRRLRSALLCKKLDDSEACRDCDLPWDGSKHGIANLLHTARRRLAI